MIKLIAFVTVLLFSTFMLKEMGFHGSKLLSTLGCVLVLIFLLEGMGRVANTVKNIAILSKLTVFTKEAMKIVGIGYIFGLTSDLCDDMGEGGISNIVQSAGRVEILVLSLPYIEEVINLSIRYFTP